MRLINTTSYNLERFPTREISVIPDYAIASHRWYPEKEELTFKEWQEWKDPKLKKPIDKNKRGYTKVDSFLKKACEDGFQYLWIDTVCMDKTNQAESADAIAEMFKYYRNSQVCYVFLADVSAEDNPYDPGSAYGSNSWFKRGWTLQELIAPQNMIFFDVAWNEIGTKSSLQDIIAQKTDIPTEVLLMNYGGLITPEERMNWARGRSTSRPEDEAYCLMGLLDIRMPVFYGEGRDAARLRLNAEIERRRGDSFDDPHKFNLAHWMTPQQDYRFDILVAHGLPSDVMTRPDSGISYQPRGSKGIDLTFPGSGNFVVLMFELQEEKTVTAFAVCLGVHNYAPWSAITADCENNNVERVANIYKDGSDKASMRWKNYDRVGLKLGGAFVRATVRKVEKEGKRQYNVGVFTGHVPDHSGNVPKDSGEVGEVRLVGIGPGFVKKPA